MDTRNEQANETRRRGYTVQERTDRQDSNANGFFVMRHGERVAGPFATLREAWCAADEHSYYGAS